MAMSWQFPCCVGHVSLLLGCSAAAAVMLATAANSSQQQRLLHTILLLLAGLIKHYCLDVTTAEILQANLDGADLAVCVVAEAGELNKCGCASLSCVPVGSSVVVMWGTPEAKSVVCCAALACTFVTAHPALQGSTSLPAPAAIAADTLCCCCCCCLYRLLNTFQSSLEEVTIIAQPEAAQLESAAGARAAAEHAVQIQSYYDPCKGGWCTFHVLLLFAAAMATAVAVAAVSGGSVTLLVGCGLGC
jgi:hypothetical protein